MVNVTFFIISKKVGKIDYKRVTANVVVKGLVSNFCEARDDNINRILIGRFRKKTDEVHIGMSFIRNMNIVHLGVYGM